MKSYTVTVELHVPESNRVNPITHGDMEVITEETSILASNETEAYYEGEEFFRSAYPYAKLVVVLDVQETEE